VYREAEGSQMMGVSVRGDWGRGLGVDWVGWGGERGAGDVRGGGDGDGDGGVGHERKSKKTDSFSVIKVRAHTPLFGIVEKNKKYMYQIFLIRF